MGVVLMYNCTSLYCRFCTFLSVFSSVFVFEFSASQENYIFNGFWNGILVQIFQLQILYILDIYSTAG